MSRRSKNSCRSGRSRQKQRIRRTLLALCDMCHWCGRQMSAEEATIEHLIPLSLGGPSGIENMSLSHRRCNQTAMEHQETQ